MDRCFPDLAYSCLFMVNNHTKIYYNIAQSLPQSLPSNVANSELKDDFDMSTMHIVMVDKDMDAKEKRQ